METTLIPSMDSFLFRGTKEYFAKMALNDRAEFAQVEIRMGGGPQVGGGGIPDEENSRCKYV